MIQVERTALVIYPVDAMYRLVESVEDYPAFLSWCNGAQLLESDACRQVATMSVSFGGLQQAFTTENTLKSNQSIAMHLIDGPFRYLSGSWQFSSVGDAGSRIALAMKFEFRHSLLSLAFERGFAHVASRLVGDFCREADVRYGDAS